MKLIVLFGQGWPSVHVIAEASAHKTASPDRNLTGHYSYGGPIHIHIHQADT